MKLSIPPPRALRYSPLDRAAHTPLKGCRRKFRGTHPLRTGRGQIGALSGTEEMNETSVINPASTMRRATSAMRRMFSIRPVSLKSRSRLRPCRTLSPSNMYVCRPMAKSRFSSRLASVDFPDAESPVNHRQQGFWAFDLGSLRFRNAEGLPMNIAGGAAIRTGQRRQQTPHWMRDQD